MIDAEFDLIDHDGCPASLANYSGSFVLVFFGFTHCRIVCPRALTRISTALDLLGPDADAVRPLYVSVDPERDTPERMKAFLGDYPRFVGLTGPREKVDAAKRAFRVYAEARPDPGEPDGYVVPHTALTYLLDRDGSYLTHFADHLDVQTMAQRLRARIEPSLDHS